jgi:hypothetical protein
METMLADLGKITGLLRERNIIGKWTSMVHF